LTSALVDFTGTVANATGIKLSYAVVHVVTNVISIVVGSAVTSANAQGVL
jgi:hypothetical protein